MASETSLSKNALFLIENSNEIEIAWSKVPDNLARHTAIVLYFDGKPQLTLDFADSQASRSSLSGFSNRFSGMSQLASPRSSAHIESAIALLPFDHDVTIEIIGTLLKFALSDATAKERVKNLLSRLLGIKMGKYHAKNNNCRHYVKEVFNILIQEPEFEEKNKISFQENMDTIEKEDKEKIENAKSILEKVAAGIGVVIGAAAVFGTILSRN